MPCSNPPKQPFFAVIGFPARDTKYMLDGTVAASLGGVLFTALALAVLARRARWVVAPVMNVGEDCAADAEAMLRSEMCDMRGVYRVSAPTQHSTITFTGENDRWERVEGQLPSLTIERLQGILDANAIVLNFITGVELERSTLAWLSTHTRAPIIVDYHTLALATLPDGIRVPRRRSDWAAWLQYATVVQMNENEAGALAGRELNDASTCEAFARELLLLGPRAVVITRADQGSIGAERKLTGSQEVQATYRIPCREPAVTVDTVGCGDVYLAGLAMGWTRWCSLEPAMRFASHVSSLHVEYEGLSGRELLARSWDSV
jgi:sugar/nucleoside kinase (ribokinase family)